MVQSSQMSSPDALGPKREQHTQITSKAHIKCDMHQGGSTYSGVRPQLVSIFGIL